MEDDDDLRWIERDGEKFLQKRHFSYYVGHEIEEWRDVPFSEK